MSLWNARELQPFVVADVRVTGRVLGEGSYGSVEEAEIPGATCVVKKLHEALLPPPTEAHGANRMAATFVAECRLMSTVRHPNIVQFLGVCLLPGSRLPALIMEKLLIDLHNLLENNSAIPLSMKHSILLGVSKGLTYLHTRNPAIIHRDLSARNVLLNCAMVAKISDLGNSRIINVRPSQLMTMTNNPGNMWYMPPEAQDNASKYNATIDVFSFGHLTLFTLTQEFPDVKAATITDPATGRINARSEVKRRSESFEQVYHELGREHPLVCLAEQCLHNLPSRRPPIAEVLERLEAVGESIRDHYSLLNKLEMVKLLWRHQEEQKRQQQQLASLEAQLRELQAQVPCPNKGCSEMLPRCDVPNHRQTCPFEVSPSSQPRERKNTPPKRVQLTLDDCATFGPVRGCTIVAERSFAITQRAEVFNWPEYGITISAPENSIPANTQSVLLNVRVSLSGPFQLEASKLMSAVYWICPNIHCMFAKPLELTVEHCAHLKHPDYHTKLTFLRTKCNQEDLPYKFKEIGGQFTAHSGTVALRSFSGVAVGSKSAESTPPLMKYVARIVTLQTHVTEWKTQYAVLKDLKSFRAFDSEKKFASSDPFTTTYTAIKFKQDTVQLELPVSGVTVEDRNWKIRPLVPPRLSIPDGESYEPFRDLNFSECSVVLEWVGLGEPSTTLHHVVALSGTADSDDFFALHVNPAQRLQQARQGSLSTQPRETKHRAIENLIPDLTTIITNKSSPVFFADHLASKGFLSAQCRMNILEKRGASPHDTVSTLLNAVVVTVKTASSPEESAKHFDNFVTIIRKGLELEDLAQKLINRCAELDEATSSMEASASFTTAPGVHQVKFTPQQNPLLATGSSQKRKVANTPATVDSSPVPQAKLLKLKRKDALIMTLPFHKDWQTIGALLEVEEEKIRAIQDEENNVSSKDCLRVLLDEWLKSTDPPPSWQALAEAVEPFDSDAADRIRRTYSNL